MRRYRNWWLSVVAALTTLGVVWALVSWPLPGVLLSFATGGVFAGAMTLAVGIESPRVGPRAGRAGFIGGAVVVAIGGLKALLGPVVLAVLVLAGVSSPAMLGLVRRLFTSDGSRDDPEPGPERREIHHDLDRPVREPQALPRRPDLQTLSDDQLCSAWRTSFVALQQATTMPGRLSVVEARQCYLDELERRNPAGLAAWLFSGARAAGDPSRYVRRTHRQPPAV